MPSAQPCSRPFDMDMSWVQLSSDPDPYIRASVLLEEQSSPLSHHCYYKASKYLITELYSLHLHKNYILQGLFFKDPSLYLRTSQFQSANQIAFSVLPVVLSHRPHKNLHLFWIIKSKRGCQHLIILEAFSVYLSLLKRIHNRLLVLRSRRQSLLCCPL